MRIIFHIDNSSLGNNNKDEYENACISTCAKYKSTMEKRNVLKSARVMSPLKSRRFLRKYLHSQTSLRDVQLSEESVNAYRNLILYTTEKCIRKEYFNPIPFRVILVFARGNSRGFSRHLIIFNSS